MTDFIPPLEVPRGEHRRVAWIVYLVLLAGFFFYSIFVIVQAIHSRREPPISMRYQVEDVRLPRITICPQDSRWEISGRTQPQFTLRDVSVRCSLTQESNTNQADGRLIPTPKPYQQLQNLELPRLFSLNPAQVGIGASSRFNTTLNTYLWYSSNCHVDTYVQYIGGDGSWAQLCFVYRVEHFSVRSEAIVDRSSPFALLARLDYEIDPWGAAVTGSLSPTSTADLMFEYGVSDDDWFTQKVQVPDQFQAAFAGQSTASVDLVPVPDEAPDSDVYSWMDTTLALNQHTEAFTLKLSVYDKLNGSTIFDIQRRDEYLPPGVASAPKSDGIVLKLSVDPRGALHVKELDPYSSTLVLTQIAAGWFMLMLLFGILFVRAEPRRYVFGEGAAQAFAEKLRQHPRQWVEFFSSNDLRAYSFQARASAASPGGAPGGPGSSSIPVAGEGSSGRVPMSARTMSMREGDGAIISMEGGGKDGLWVIDGSGEGERMLVRSASGTGIPMGDMNPFGFLAAPGASGEGGAPGPGAKEPSPSSSASSFYRTARMGPTLYY